MTLIEGVGNEVVQFFFVVICGLVMLLAWWSTAHYVNSNGNAEAIVENNSGESNTSEDNSPEETEGTSETVNVGTENEEVASGESSNSQDAEMNSIVDTMDSDASVLRNRRLAFFANKNEPNSDSDKKDDFEEPVKQTLPNNEENISTEDISTQCDSDDNIRIRLKYLNDDLKLVEGKLQEPLGEFKRRHFKGELSARKLVRLIFNGQVLQREAATLESCGLFDNCVVHCLVHQPRTPQQLVQAQQQLNPNSTSSNNNNNIDNQRRNQPLFMDGGVPDERDWDLSHILFTLLASLLSIAWYIHIRFSSLFGVAASLAMLGLTGIYIIAVVCVYFPDAHLSAFSSNPPLNRGRAVSR